MVDRGGRDRHSEGTWRHLGFGPLANPDSGRADRFLEHRRPSLAQNGASRNRSSCHLRNLTKSTASRARRQPKLRPRGSRAMRVFVLILTFLSLFLYGVPVQASQAEPPGQKAGKYTRWFYPSQMSYGPIEEGTGNTSSSPASGAFLTLPFMGPHYITSIFDHCGPDYGTHGSVCRYDGQVASSKVGGPDPSFDAGYAQTPAGHDYLYYDGHDGYDYGLTYEPVAAAAPGTVMLANWLDPNCHSCLSGQTIEINHGNGLLSFYGHLSQINVVKGQYVARGQVIGISGMTGTATGPHLHWGVYKMNGGGPVDPYGWAGSYPGPWGKDNGGPGGTRSPRKASIAVADAS